MFKVKLHFLFSLEKCLLKIIGPRDQSLSPKQKRVSGTENKGRMSDMPLYIERLHVHTTYLL